MNNKILIVDDEIKITRALTFLLEDEYTVFTANNFMDALDIFLKEEIYLVLLDLRLSDKNGLELMGDMLSKRAEAIVIIMTAYSTIENSIRAIKEGAFYFITKPIDKDELLLLLKQANSKLDMLEKISDLESYVKKDLIGKSAAIEDIIKIIDKVKDTNATILITGESGTGKELIAQRIHRTSNRMDKPFTAINCAAIPGELLESELFGYKKGAFTGAYRDEIGIIRRSEGGTLLLDEIGEMDLRLQSKLLRFLQEHTVRQIGSSEDFDSDVRVICITNKDLKREVELENFREDLYYRINVINIEVPPLRDRIEDIKPLIEYFITKYNISFNRKVQGITDEAYNTLIKYNFTGNIRELENIIQRAVLLSNTDYIEKEIFDININTINKNLNYNDEDATFIKIFPSDTLADVERKVIKFSLNNNGQNRKRTAENLGISERGLRYKIREYDI